MKEKKQSIRQLTQKEQAAIFHQDGIVDIIGGVVLLNFGLDIINQSTTTSLFTYIPILLLSSMKNQVTIARIGYQAFGGDERRTRRWIFSIVAGMVVTLLAMGTLVLGGSLNLEAVFSWLPEGNLRTLLAGLIIALACLIAALSLPLQRYQIYAAVAITAGLIGFMLFPPFVPVFASAAAMLTLGIRLMVKFIKAYPLDTKKKNK